MRNSLAPLTGRRMPANVSSAAVPAPRGDAAAGAPALVLDAFTPPSPSRPGERRQHVASAAVPAPRRDAAAGAHLCPGLPRLRVERGRAQASRHHAGRTGVWLCVYMWCVPGGMRRRAVGRVRACPSRRASCWTRRSVRFVSCVCLLDRDLAYVRGPGGRQGGAAWRHPRDPAFTPKSSLRLRRRRWILLRAAMTWLQTRWCCLVARSAARWRSTWQRQTPAR